VKLQLKPLLKEREESGSSKNVVDSESVDANLAWRRGRISVWIQSRACLAIGQSRAAWARQAEKGMGTSNPVAVSNDRTAPRRARVLTTHNKKYHVGWYGKTTLLEGWQKEWDLRKSNPRRHRLLRDIYWGWKLFRLSRHYDAVATGMERPARIFAVLQRILRRRRVPHVVIQYVLNEPPNPFLRAIKRIQNRFEGGGFTRIVVYSRKQPQWYRHTQGLPESKFVTIPFHTTLYETQYTVSDGDYIFSGGDVTRDYASLIEAVRGTPYRTVIAARFRHYFNGVDVPKNVEIVTVPHEEFISLMAGAALVVIPLRSGLLHSGGHQTYLNAMTMGKALVVADSCDADEFITHGVTGWLLQPGDTPALREAIVTLMEDRERAHQLGQNAKAAALDFVPDRFFERALDVIEECVREAQTEA
jgi:glycosyltransferase involved in cell wall biosynthesis